MFRLNRIGDHHVADLSADEFVFDPSAANFVTSLGTIEQHFVQTDSAVLGDPVRTMNMNTADTIRSYVIAGSKTHCFGIFVSGASLNERSMMLGYSGAIMVKTNPAANALVVNANMGMAKAATVTVDKTAQTNEMDTKMLLGTAVNPQNNVYHYLKVRGTVINTVLNGGASGLFDTNPLGFWFSFLSIGAGSTIITMQASMSLYRYTQDLDTFDPNR